MIYSRRQFIEKDLFFSKDIDNLTKKNHSPTSTNDSHSPRDHSNTFNESG